MAKTIYSAILNVWVLKRKAVLLFNNALNTFYLWLYGLIYRTIPIARDETQCHHFMGYSFLSGTGIPDSSKGSFFIHSPTDKIAYTVAFVSQVVEHWME